MHNDKGEDMNFIPYPPNITDKQIDDIQVYVQHTNPEITETKDIVEVTSQMGKMLVAGIPIPTCVRGWVEKVPMPCIIFAEIACESLLANTNFVTAKAVAQSMYSLTAIRWLRTPL